MERTEHMIAVKDLAKAFGKVSLLFCSTAIWACV